MGTYFAYARVSTPRQGEKGVSLPEQKEAIERYANLHGLTVARWFEERESASRSGRRAFTEMLRLLRLGKVQGVIIHKIDRSARNLEDWADVGKLVDAGVEVHFATENLDLRTVAGRLSADIQAVVAAHYSRNLREEVKKGLYGRLKQGFYPLRAPIGYLDQGSAKPKTHDPLEGPLVREAFELYGTGKFSLPMLVKEMFRCGLRNRSGGHVSLNGLAKMLKNPFYIGLLRIYKNGETYTGNHEPLITTQLFEKVQALLAGKRVDRATNHLLTYSRIVRCKTCGYSLIAEKQKGHLYYRCHNRPFKIPAKCPPTCVREETLDEAVIASLAEVDLREDEMQVARALLATQRKKLDTERTATVQALQLQLDQLQTRVGKLADLLVDGAIEKSLFTEKQNTLLLDRTRIRERLAEIENGSCRAIDRMEKIVELAKSPSTLYREASPQNRRQLLPTLLSNLTVSGKNIEITLALPFRLIAEREKLSSCGPNRGICRTWEQTIITLQKHFKDNLSDE